MRLPPQQILNGMKDRAGVGLDRDPVLGTQDIEIERRHERGERGAGRLVASHLEPVSTGPQVVGVVDHPGGQPEHLAFQRAKTGQALWIRRRGRFATINPSARGDIQQRVHRELSEKGPAASAIGTRIYCTGKRQLQGAADFSRRLRRISWPSSPPPRIASSPLESVPSTSPGRTGDGHDANATSMGLTSPCNQPVTLVFSRSGTLFALFFAITAFPS